MSDIYQQILRAIEIVNQKVDASRSEEAMFSYNGNPNAALTAGNGALCWDYTNNVLYVNTSDPSPGTTWAAIAGGVGAGGVTAPFGIPYNWRTATAHADPGSGNMRGDHGTPANVTGFYLDEIDACGDTRTEHLTWFESINNDAIIFVTSEESCGEWWVGEVVAVAPQGGWWDVTVSYIDHGGTFDSGETLYVVIMPSTLGSGGLGGTYLRLDCTNDPLTPANPDAALEIQGHLNLNGGGAAVKIEGDHALSIEDSAGNRTNTLIGDTAADIGDATYGVIAGYGSAASGLTGDYNTIIGAEAGNALTTQEDTVLIGYRAGHDETGAISGTVAIGREAGADNLNAITESVIIGYKAGRGSDADVYGMRGVVIGYEAATNCTYNELCVIIGRKAAYTVTNDVEPTCSVIIGDQAAYDCNQDGGAYSPDIAVIIGYQAGYKASCLNAAVVIGESAGRGNTEYPDVAGGVLVGEGAGYNTDIVRDSAVLGLSAHSRTSGEGNIAIGSFALNNCGAGSGSDTGWNVTIGYAAMEYVTNGGDMNVAIGETAGANTHELGYNVIVGAAAASYHNTTLEDSIAIGYMALAGHSIFGDHPGGGTAVVIGHLAAAYNTKVNDSVVIGYGAGYYFADTTTGIDDSVVIGSQACYSIDGSLGVDDSVVIGHQASYDNDAVDDSVVIGHNAWRGGGGGANQASYRNVIIGHSVGYDATYAPVIREADDSVIIGTEAFAGHSVAEYDLIADLSVVIGSEAFWGALDVGAGYAAVASSVCIGDSVCGNSSDVQVNVVIGSEAGLNIASAYYNVIIGAYSGKDLDGTGGVGTAEGNVLVGAEAGNNMTTSYGTVAVGCYAMGTGVVTGDWSVAVGADSLEDLTSGEENVAVGSYAGHQLTTGSNNTLIGDIAGYNLTTASGCVFIGHDAGRNETDSNRLYIDNSNTSTPLIYGEFDNDILIVHGQLKMQHNGTARTVVVADGVITATTTVSNTTSETTVYTESIPGGDLHSGYVVKVRILGRYSTVNASDTFQLRLKIAGTTIHTITSTAANVTDGPLDIEMIFTVRAVGASGAVWSYASASFNNEKKDVADTSADAVDTTAADDVTVTIEWDAADPSNSVSIDQGWAEFISDEGSLELETGDHLLTEAGDLLLLE